MQRPHRTASLERHRTRRDGFHADALIAVKGRAARGSTLGDPMPVMPVPSTLSPFSVGRASPDTGEAAVAAQQWLAAAERLRAAFRIGAAGHPLVGKNLAVLQPSGATEASPLQCAATDLGARVAQVRLGEPPPTAADFAHIARMLGRFYDAIDASRLPQDAAAELQKHAGVPVYRGLGDGDHPVRALAAHMARQAGSDGDDLRFVLQALLVRTMT